MFQQLCFHSNSDYAGAKRCGCVRRVSMRSPVLDWKCISVLGFIKLCLVGCTVICASAQVSELVCLYTTKAARCRIRKFRKFMTSQVKSTSQFWVTSPESECSFSELPSRWHTWTQCTRLKTFGTSVILQVRHRTIAFLYHLPCLTCISIWAKEMEHASDRLTWTYSKFQHDMRRVYDRSGQKWGWTSPTIYWSGSQKTLEQYV